MSSRTVAIVGASTVRSKFGNKSVRAHQAAGYEVYPVNPRADEVEGLAAYASVKDVPVDLNRVTLYLPPALGIKMLSEIAEKGCDELFLNPGTESDELIAEAERLGLNVVTGCSIIDVGYSPSDFEG